jgi:hypothetical protein
MTGPYPLEPVRRVGRYHVHPGSAVDQLADLPNLPYHRGKTFTERLGRMGREIP